MGMPAILVMWPGPFEQTFVPQSHGDSIWNLASIGPVVSEEKMFKECGRWTGTEAYLSYKIKTKKHLSHIMTKPTIWLVSPAKTQINIGVR